MMKRITVQKSYDSISIVDSHHHHSSVQYERPRDGERLALETAAFQVGQTFNSLPTLNISVW